MINKSTITWKPFPEKFPTESKYYFVLRKSGEGTKFVDMALFTGNHWRIENKRIKNIIAFSDQESIFHE